MPPNLQATTAQPSIDPTGAPPTDTTSATPAAPTGATWTTAITATAPAFVSAAWPLGYLLPTNPEYLWVDPSRAEALARMSAWAERQHGDHIAALSAEELCAAKFVVTKHAREGVGQHHQRAAEQHWANSSRAAASLWRGTAGVA